MERMETAVTWITLGLVAVCLVLQAIKYRKSRDKWDMISAILYVLVATALVVLLRCVTQSERPKCRTRRCTGPGGDVGLPGFIAARARRTGELAR